MFNGNRVRVSTFMNAAIAGVLVAILFFTGCSLEEPKSNDNIPVRVYLKRLKSDREATVEKALNEIGEIGGPATPYILEKWEKASDEEKIIYCKAIYRIGPGAAAAVPTLIEELNSLEELVIAHAALGLAGIGPAAAPAVDKLTALLRSSDTSTQANVLLALGNIGPAAASSLPRVKEAAFREKTRSAAIVAMSKMGPKAVNAMSEWLKSDEVSKVIIACEVLGGMGANASEALPLITKAFDSKDPRAREAAALAIGATKEKGIVVLPQMIDALNEQDSRVRASIINAITELGPDAAEEALKSFGNSSWRVREGCIRVVARFANIRDKSIEKLIGRMNDSNVEVRGAAIDALSGVGPSIVPRMIGVLDSPQVNLRFGASRVLGNQGAIAKSALPKLHALTKDKDSLVSQEAMKAIKQIM
ncbi:HEAT repeat domain-containing protein [bacterium]|nr:HEAT repeat domain-containing protein [bacterium]